jgi:hypothetical protein
MKTKELYFFPFLSLTNSRIFSTTCRGFSQFIYTLFSCHGNQSYKGRDGHGFLNLNNHKMKENHGNWERRFSISKLPKMLLVGIFLAMGTFSYAQTNANTPMARMMLNNTITIRSGLNAQYKIPMGHFGFASQQEAVAYFQARDVNYIDFVVLDEETVLMNFDLTDPAVANWTLADWKQALATRASNTTPRTLPSN